VAQGTARDRCGAESHDDRDEAAVTGARAVASPSVRRDAPHVIVPGRETARHDRR
jgi:hypothetical protein